jgi:hypothetical protein
MIAFNPSEPLDLTTANFGIDQTVFPNTVYNVQYELYKKTTPVTLTNVSNEVQYIVYGDGTCTYNGNTYREGEVFIAENNGAVSFTGGAKLAELLESRHKFYTFVWELKQRLYNIVHENLNNQANDYTELLDKIQSELDSLDWANYTQQISISKAQKTINWINEKLTEIENAG